MKWKHKWVDCVGANGRHLGASTGWSNILALHASMTSTFITHSYSPKPIFPGDGETFRRLCKLLVNSMTMRSVRSLCSHDPREKRPIFESIKKLKAAKRALIIKLITYLA